MIGQYWAQPHGQRLTFHHSTAEVTGKGRLPSRKPRESPEKIAALVAYLKTGPKTKKELRKFLKMPGDKIDMIIMLASTYEPRLWEEYIKEGNKVVCYFGIRED